MPRYAAEDAATRTPPAPSAPEAASRASPADLDLLDRDLEAILNASTPSAVILESPSSIPTGPDGSGARAVRRATQFWTPPAVATTEAARGERAPGPIEIPRPGAPRPGPGSLPKGPTPSLSAAPVMFLGDDGRTVAQQAFFTLGKGGGLDAFLGDLLRGWEATGKEMVSVASAQGITVTLKGDDQGRMLRILPSGTYVLRLSAEEQSRWGALPSLVSARALGRADGPSA